MQTIFSHIVQKRFSQQNEDVATDALLFILEANLSAHNGMMKLVRGIAPGMPDLRFKTQQTEGSIRPDMWGYDGVEPRVFIENKFWAGLTENQPVAYLQQLAQSTQPTILLVVGPDARVQTLWRECSGRLRDAGISASEREFPSGVIVRSVTTDIGPIFAFTSWTRLLDFLEPELADVPQARSDLLQLRALCEAADSDAFVPIASEDVTDQRIPALVLQLNSVVQAIVELAITEKVLDIKRLKPQASGERIGRYARFSNVKGVGVWFGIHFPLWKKHGSTPLWLLFSPGEFGRAQEVQPILEPWAERQGIFSTFENNDLAVAVPIACGEDKDQVLRHVVDFLKGIAEVLSPLRSQA
ncbi:MAG: hypothetical protein JXR84_24450 [Anaerolineae bacterium]|nr:hypothetical protein [Anaerolineae bacterium]